MPGLKNRCRGWNQMPKALGGEKLEPDAEGLTAGTGTTPAAFYLGLCRNENWNRTRSFVAAGTVATPAAFYLGLCRLRGIQSPPASATASCRRNRSPLRQRRIESDADLVAATATVGGPFFTAAARTLHRFPILGLKSRINARRRA